MTSSPVVIPDYLINELPPRARRILTQEGISSCESVLKLEPDDLRRFRGCGAQTACQFGRLQDAISRKYPELSLLYRRRKIPSGKNKSVPENPSSRPAEWSILNCTLAQLFRLSPAPFDLGTDPERTIGSLSIPAADLERLRATALYPEDPVHLFCSLSLGYLIEAELSDATLTTLFAAILESYGPMGVSPASLATTRIPDSSLYPEADSGHWDALRLPEFHDPTLREGEIPAIPMATWGEVAQLTERTVIERWGFTASALRGIRQLWRLRQLAPVLREGVTQGIQPQAYGEFHLLADAYLRLALAPPPEKSAADLCVSQRDFRILQARLGLLDGRRGALVELARQEKVTRERVRQVEAKLMALCQHPHTLQHLAYLWLWLDSLLSAGGGALYASEIAASLGNALGWSWLPSDAALASLIALSPDYLVIWQEPVRVLAARHGCVNCPAIKSALALVVVSAPWGELAIEKVSQALRECCKDQRCPGTATVTRFSNCLLHCLADASEDISLHNGLLFSRQARWKKKTEPRRVLEHILLGAEKGLHFKEVHRQYSLALPEKPLSPATVHERLSIAPSCLLWGQGTFIHRDLVAVPTDLMKEIQEEILRTFHCHDIPYVCLNGHFFQKYKDRLLAENVPNPPALYSCLRAVSSAALSFAEYPYCQVKGRGAARPTISVALEDYLLKGGVPVPRKELRNFVLTILGVEKTQLDGYMAKIPNVLRITQSRLVHCKTVGIEKSQLAPIAKYLLRLEGRPITARSLYLENLPLCRNLAILTPMLLSDLIRHFYPGEFPFTSTGNGYYIPIRPRSAGEHKNAAATSRRPVTSRSDQPAAIPSKEPATFRPDKPAPVKGHTVANQILAYITEQAKPCSTRDLLDFVRGKQRSRANLCFALAYDEEILWHTTRSVITRQVLNWTDAKQTAIEQLAAEHLEKSDAPFGLCSEVYRDKQGQFPELAQHIPWTPVLLHDLLGSQGRYLALGRTRDVFVSASNRHGIASLNDLYLYLLRTDYGGVAHRASFISHLRRVGALWKNRSTFVLGHDKRVVIDGDLIRIAD
jgi:hypothetical protein